MIKSQNTRRVVNNIRKQLNNILDDQISSESQNEEILPSSTLLLQTSFTTFTYFTTQYAGDTSHVLSRLETITNVVTETLQPTQTIVIPPASLNDEAVLPTTYFTTFTYWTTQFKDGEVVTTSSQKVVSNVIAPTAAVDQLFSTARVVEDLPSIVLASPPTITASVHDFDDEDQKTDEVALVTPTATPTDPTTYFTTYTYYTTSYIGDETILNSRFETVTNVVTPTQKAVATVTPVGRAIQLDNANFNQISDKKSEKKLAKHQNAKTNEENIVSINVGKIVDAEGISTIFYTTKAIGTVIDDVYSQITQKTSSINVDESKKQSILEATPNYAENKHKTGLVRLIDGKIIANHTTTLYQSKVIGTMIDNRYAQIIESTSSYVIGKTQDAGIAPSSVSGLGIKPTHSIISPTSAAVESSLSDPSETDNEEGEEGEGEADENEEEVDENGHKKSRLTFATKKRTFTPIIRPFASRNRPTFSPKRKNLVASSATIISRSDFTPTITATPAIGKQETSTRRFNGGARRSSNAPHALSSSTSSTASSSSSKRFSRLRTSAVVSSTINPSGSARILRPSAIRPTASGSLTASSRKVGNLFKSSALPGSRLAILPSQVRFRSNPTLTPSRDITTTKAPDTEEATTEAIEENDGETDKEDEVATTTENARRNQNPLLRFRRPLTPSANRFQATNTSRPVQPVVVTTRRSPLLQRGRASQSTTTTTTTAKPKRSFQKPPGLTAISNRPRTSANSLFPPRSLFKTTTEANPEDLNDVNEANHEEPNDDQIEIDDGAEGAADADDENRNRRENKVAFTPQSSLRIRQRSKRQIDYGTRTLSRYRRPAPNQTPQISARSSYDDVYYDDIEVPTQRPKPANTRYTSRYRPSNADNNDNVGTQQSNPNSRIRYSCLFGL